MWPAAAMGAAGAAMMQSLRLDLNSNVVSWGGRGGLAAATSTQTHPHKCHLKSGSRHDPPETCRLPDGCNHLRSCRCI